MVRNDMVNYGHKFTPEEYARLTGEYDALGPRSARTDSLGDVLRHGGVIATAWSASGTWDRRITLPAACQRGFDFFYGHGNNGIDYFTHERYGVPSMFRDNARTQADKRHLRHRPVKRESIRFRAPKRRDRPFFLYLCFNAPPRRLQFRQGRRCRLPANSSRNIRRWIRRRSSRLIMQRSRAWTLRSGELWNTLRETGQDKNTLIIFQSDNGGSGNGGNAPLKGQKSTMWEGGLRVPFIAWWPGKSRLAS